MMSRNSNIIDKFFRVVANGQTYLNYIYLFLAFPLGLIYFIFLVVGISVGLATIIVWVGLLILLMVIAGWWLLAGFERIMAISLLRVDIQPMSTARSDKAQTTMEKLGAFLSNPVTWKGLVFLLAKFPLGIVSFVTLVTLTAVTIILITSPLTFRFIQPEVWLWGGGVWRIDTLGEALIGAVAGVLLFFISLHIFNALAWVSGKFAQVMLGNPQPNTSVVSVVAPEAQQPPEVGVVPEPQGTAATDQDAM
ncbi:MAG: sensor domain-containing protein [Bellilinea sp.]